MAKREGGTRANGRYRESAPGRPLVSVVTVVLDGEKHLEQTIRSVLDQTYENIEYVIIDGGSTDTSLDIIAGYADRIDYWISEPDSGIYDAMNKGVGLATGELIGILNADDFFEPDAVAAVVAAYKALPSPAIVYGDNYKLHDDLGLHYTYKAHMRYWLGMPLCHQSMFVPMMIYKNFGGYTEQYGCAADYDFLLRMVLNRVNFQHAGKILVHYRADGRTHLHYLDSLKEAKKINRQYLGACSLLRVRFLLRYLRTTVFFLLQIVLRSLCGDRLLNKARIMYLKHVIAKGSYKGVETIGRVDNV